MEHRVAVIASLLIVMLALQPVLAGVPGSPLRSARAAPPPNLTIGVLRTIDSLNPYIGVNDPSYLLYGLLYDYPFSYDQDGNLVSNLLTDAVCTDASCMNWTYSVRQGVTWSDGTNFTAADVAFTFNYDSQNLFHLWAFEPYFNEVVQCTGGNAGHCGAVISGSWQVTVYFQRPFVAGKTLFAPIVQEAQWSGVSPQQAETTYQNPNPIGTGPFIADPNIFTEWQNQLTQPIHLYLNPNYHPVGGHIGASWIQDIYIQVFTDVNTLATALEAGSVQLAQMTIAGIQAVQGQPNILTQTPLQAIQMWNEIGITQIDTLAADGRLNPARFDLNVRQALAHATNKDYIVQQFYSGQGVRGDSLLSPVTPQWWYDPVAGGDNLTFDLAAANALLNATGWTGTWSDGTNNYRMNPNPITVSYQTACYQCINPPNVTKTIPAGTHLELLLATRPSSTNPEEVATGNYLITAYQQIGIKIDLKVETTEQALETDVYAGNVDMYIWYWSGDPDPNYLLSMQSSWTLDGWSDNYWNNGTYNYDYIAELGQQNLTQRIAYVQAAEKIEYESAVYILYTYPYGQWAMRTDLWQGWGDWSAHPYRQMNAYWGANPLWFDLNCPSCAYTSPNEPPTPPVISGASNVTTQEGVNATFTATTSDPESTDTLNFTWDWGDGSSSSTTTSATNPVSTYGHSWSLNSGETYHIYQVNVRVDDGHNPPVSNSNPVHVNVTVALSASGHFQGIVRDTSNQPIAYAQVLTSPGGFFGMTATNGTYRIDVPPGSYNLTATKALFSTQTKPSTVGAAQTVTVDFQLTPNDGWLAGQVTAAGGGGPIPGATVRAIAGDQTSVVGSTDTSGVYNLTLAPGTYTVNVSATGYLLRTTTGVVIETGAVTRANFALSLDHGWLTGHVTDGSGHPVASATVLVAGASAAVTGGVTDASGSYNMSVALGLYTVTVTATGYTPQSRSGLKVSSGNATVVDFSLVPAPGRIFGFILDAGSAPIANATVIIAQAGGQGSVVLYTVTTDGAGAYSQVLLPGTYLVTVSAPGYFSQNRSGIVVDPGQAVEVNFTLRLAPSSSIPLWLVAVGLAGGMLAVVAAVVIFLLVRRRRKPA